MRKYIPWRQGGKDQRMSDTEAKILELIQGLTLARQMDVLNHALAMLAAKQEMSPALSATSDERNS